MKLPIDKEWFEKRAAAEGDLEISAGRRFTKTLNLTADEVAELERLAFEALPSWARTELTKLRKQVRWQPMGTAPRDRTEVIIACPCATAPGQYIVSAAYFDPDAYGGTWWWSGTRMGEWGDSPVEDINEMPAFWQPMPAGPSPTTSNPSGGVDG